MAKRYQVFVSSTYEDLRLERQEVMHALLEIDCIPAGMELFPAANDDQWQVIQRVIDECDYYVLIVAGRYGSVDSDGMSYTEKEYRYALDRKKPICAFLHQDPKSLPMGSSEQSDEGRQRLDDFRELIRQNRLCKNWTSAQELGGIVSRSVIQLIKNSPAVGWVRGDSLSDAATKEILELRRQVEHLSAELAVSRVAPPVGTELLSQGEDTFEITVRYEVSVWDDFGGKRQLNDRQENCTLSWNEVFGAISPLLIDEDADYHLRMRIAGLATKKIPTLSQLNRRYGDYEVKNLQISDGDYDLILVQLRALGLVTQSTKARSAKDRLRYWTLTPWGDAVMNRLIAKRRELPPQH